MLAPSIRGAKTWLRHGLAASSVLACRIGARSLCGNTSPDDRERMLLAANALADKLLAHGQIAKGCDVLGGALDGLRDLKGDRHPDTVSLAGYLAQQLIKLPDGKGDEIAESLAREAYENARLMWGKEHQEASLAASTLAQVLAHCGHLEEAEMYLRMCFDAANAVAAEAMELSAKEVHLCGDGCDGSDGGDRSSSRCSRCSSSSSSSSDTEKSRGGTTIEKRDGYAGSPARVRQELLIAASNLAQVLLDQDRASEALPYAEIALEASSVLLGTHHGDTLEELQLVARAFEDSGAVDNAIESQRLASQRSREIFGEDHPSTLTASSNLARLLGGTDISGAQPSPREESLLSEAEQLMSENIALTARVHGPSHPQSLAAVSHLAQLLHRRERYIEAMPYVREALHISSSVLGTDHEYTRVMKRLLVSTKQEARHEEAAVKAALAHQEQQQQASMLLLASWPRPGASLARLHFA